MNRNGREVEETEGEHGRAEGEEEKGWTAEEDGEAIFKCSNMQMTRVSPRRHGTYTQQFHGDTGQQRDTVI